MEFWINETAIVAVAAIAVAAIAARTCVRIFARDGDDE